LLGRAFERVVRGAQHTGRQSIEIGLAHREPVGFFGSGIGNGEDRALDGLRKRGAGSGDRIFHRDREFEGIDRIAVPHIMGKAAQHLRENHARIAARAEQGAVSSGKGYDRERLIFDLMSLGQRRPDGQIHIGAGIPIGDRKHVEVVEDTAVFS